MPNKRLVVLDYIPENSEEFRGSDVLIIGCSLLKLERINFKQFNLIKFDSKTLERLKIEARDFYIQLPFEIYENVHYLKELKDDYWLMSHTEKNIWSSEAIHFLFYLRQIQEVRMSYSEIKFQCKNIRLNQFLSGKKIADKNLIILTYLKELYKFFYKFFVLREYRNAINLEKKNVLVSLYPDWIKFVGENKVKEIFFGDKFQIGQENVAALVLQPWQKARHALREDKEKIKSSNVVFVESFFCIFDFLRILNPRYVKIHISNKFFSSDIKFNGTDISNLISYEINRSFTDGAFFTNLLLKMASKRCFRFPPKRIFYRLEFQPFENAFLNKTLATEFIGLQHSVYGDFFVNYLFPQETLKKFKNLVPTKILYTGKRIKEALLIAGVDKDSLEPVGAFRFSSMFDERFKETKLHFREELKIKNCDLLIFMPISQILSENLILVQELKIALDKLNKDVHVVVKINPNKKNDQAFITTMKNELSLLEKDLIKIDLIIDSPYYYEYIKASDFIIMSGGSASFEAYFLSTPSIIFDVENIICHNPSTSYPDFFHIARSADDFYNVLSKKSEIQFADRNNLMEDFFSNITIESNNKFKTYLSESL